MINSQTTFQFYHIFWQKSREEAKKVLVLFEYGSFDLQNDKNVSVEKRKTRKNSDPCEIKYAGNVGKCCKMQIFIYNNFYTIPSTPKGVRTPVDIAWSPDGQKWQHVICLEESPVRQYSYPSIIQGRDGMLHCVYTWRRQRVKYVKINPLNLK